MNSLRRLIFCRTLLPKMTTNFTQCREYEAHVAAVRRELRRRQLKYGEPAPTHRKTHLEWNYKAELYSFGKRLGEEFDDQLLRIALTQRSYLLKLEEEQKQVGIVVTSDEEKPDNTHLATKGEEIIEHFVLDYLRYILPRFPEEGIQSITRHLLSEETLAYVAFHIGASELILCADFPVENSTLKNVMKALIAALHESSGLERTALFIRDFIITQLAERDINDFWPIENPIEVLNTICRNEGVPEPEPRLVGHAGVNTVLALYRVGYFVDKKLIGLGPGETVQIAKEIAALDALRRLFGTAQDQLSMRFDLVLDPNVRSIPNICVENWCEKNIQERQERNRCND